MVKNNYKGRSNSFYSKKIGKTIELRSLLERKYASIIESDRRVLTYDYESIIISYRTKTGELRNYNPDFLVVYIDKSIKIVEVKPSKFVDTEEVNCKKAGVEEFLKKMYPDNSVTYHIITEQDMDTHRVIEAKVRERTIKSLEPKDVKRRRRKKKVSVTRHRDNGTK